MVDVVANALKEYKETVLYGGGMAKERFFQKLEAANRVGVISNAELLEIKNGIADILDESEQTYYLNLFGKAE